MPNPNTHCVAAITLILAGIMITTLVHGKSLLKLPPLPKPKLPPLPKPKLPPMPPLPKLPPLPPGLKDGVKRHCTDMFEFALNCAEYMHKLSYKKPRPDSACCASASKVNILIFCQVFRIKGIEKVFSGKNVATTAKSCGHPLPQNTQCGGYLVHGFQARTETNSSVEINVDGNNIIIGTD